MAIPGMAIPGMLPDWGWAGAAPEALARGIGIPGMDDAGALAVWSLWPDMFIPAMGACGSGWLTLPCPA